MTQPREPTDRVEKFIKWAKRNRVLSAIIILSTAVTAVGGFITQIPGILDALAWLLIPPRIESVVIDGQDKNADLWINSPNPIRGTITGRHLGGELSIVPDDTGIGISDIALTPVPSNGASFHFSFTIKGKIQDGEILQFAFRNRARTSESFPYKVHYAEGWISKAPLPVPVDFPAVVLFPDNAVYVAGGNSKGEASQVQKYYVANDKWETEKSPDPMPEGRWQTDGAVVIKDRFYVLGGWRYYVDHQRALPLDNLWSYMPASNTWEAGPSLPHHQGGSGSACGASGYLENNLYVMSPEVGVNGYYQFLDTLDMSDPDQRHWKWEPHAPPAAAHACGAFGVIDDKLYVAGGVTGGHRDAHMTAISEVYDPGQDKWTTLADMPVAVRSPGNAVGCGRLFVVGGIGSDDKSVPTVQIYEPPKSDGQDRRGGWTQGKFPLPSARVGLGAVVADRDLYVLGGRSEDGSIQNLVQAIRVCKE